MTTIKKQKANATENRHYNPLLKNRTLLSAYKKVANGTKNTNYNLHFENRIKCDASTAELGAALEQPSPTGWHTDALASRVLYSKGGYKVNETELLRLVWSVEYFRQ